MESSPVGFFCRSVVGRLVVLAACFLFSPAVSNLIADELSYDKQVRPLLKKYCFECHSQESKHGNLSLDQFSSTEDAVSDRKLWWKVLKNLRSGVMPPAGEDRPSPDEIEKVAH